jgi:hypothetical protein
MHHRRLHSRCEVDELLVRPGAAGARQDRHPAGGVERLGRGGQGGVRGADDRRRRPDRRAVGAGRGVGEEDVAGHHDDADPAALRRRPHRDLEYPWELLGGAD